MKNPIKVCTNCDSNLLKWYLGLRGPSDVVDGRLRMHEISTIAYLGCEECSETLAIIEDHEIEEKLNSREVPLQPPFMRNKQ